MNETYTIKCCGNSLVAAHRRTIRSVWEQTTVENVLSGYVEDICVDIYGKILSDILSHEYLHHGILHENCSEDVTVVRLRNFVNTENIDVGKAKTVHDFYKLTKIFT